MSGEFDDVSSDEFRNALDNSAENATFNRIKNMKIADRIDALSKLKVQKPEEYEKLKAAHKGEMEEFADADAMVNYAKSTYNKIKKAHPNDTSARMKEIKVLEETQDSQFVELVRAVAQVNGDREVDAKKVEAIVKGLDSYVYQSSLSKSNTSEETIKKTVMKRLDEIAKDRPLYEAVVNGIARGEIKVSDELKNIVKEREKAKQLEAEAQNRTDRGKLYETVDKDLRSLKTDKEKASFAKKLEVFSQRSGYSQEYYKAAVVLVDSKKYPEDVENLVRETQQKAKERAAKANEGQENAGQENGGNSGGGRSGGARTTGKMTLDRACNIGPTALQEYIEANKDNFAGISFEGAFVTKTLQDGKEIQYIPSKKMKGILRGLTPDQQEELRNYINSDQFRDDINRINARDKYESSSRSAAGNGSRAAGEKQSLEDDGIEVEFKPKEKTEPKQEQAAATEDVTKKDGAQKSKVPGLETSIKLAQELSGKIKSEEKPKELTPEEQKKRDDFIACKDKYKNNEADLKKQIEGLEAQLQANSGFAGAKELKEQLDLMKDVEKYLKLEKQMQKDSDKASKLQNKINKARNKQKDEKAQKLEEKKVEVENANKGNQTEKDKLDNKYHIMQNMQTDQAKAADAQTPEKKKGNIFKRAGQYISDKYDQAKDYVEKKKVEITENKEAKETTYTLTGFEGRKPEDKDKLTNGTYKVKHKGENATEVVYVGKDGSEKKLDVDAVAFERALKEADLRSKGKDLTATFLPQQRGGRE